MTGRRKPGPHNQGGGTAAGGGPVSAGRTTRTGSAGIRVAAAADLGAPFSAPQLVTATTRWSALAVTPLRQAPSSRSGFVKPREFGISNRCASRGGQAGRFPARRPPTGAEPLFPQGAPADGPPRPVVRPGGAGRGRTARDPGPGRLRPGSLRSSGSVQPDHRSPPADRRIRQPPPVAAVDPDWTPSRTSGTQPRPPVPWPRRTPPGSHRDPLDNHPGQVRQENSQLNRTRA